MLKVLLSTCLPEEQNSTSVKSRSISQCESTLYVSSCIDVYHAFTATPVYSIRGRDRKKKKRKREKDMIYLLILAHDYPQRDRANLPSNISRCKFFIDACVARFSSDSALRAVSLTVSVWYTTTARNHINWSFQVNINPVSGERFSAPGGELTNSTIIATKTTTVPVCARVLLSNEKLPIYELITTGDDEVPPIAR